MPLKIAMSTYSMYGGWLCERLLSEGHKVDIYLENPEYANILGGIIPPPLVKAKGDPFPPYKKYDLSLFDLTGREKQAEYSAQYCPTLGDGAFNCAAEDDRNFGIEVMEEAGVQVPPYERFTEVSSARSFIKKTGKRYVYKPDGGQEQDCETTYVSSSAEDMLEYLEKVNALTKGAPFILQEVIKGTEVSVNAFFNGFDFYLPLVTLEEKKFMNEGNGPNTGCAGNLIFPLNEGSELYKQGLKKLTKYLKSIQYTGMIDLNTIANDQGLWGLEWTPRFGYDSSAAEMLCYGGNYGEMLYKIATGQVPDISWKHEFAAGIRLSIPPYPSEFKGKHPSGVPVKGIEPDDLDECYLYDVMLDKKDSLVTAGYSGFIAVPMGGGNSIGEAFARCDSKIENIHIPNMQIRTDIEKCTTKRYNEIERMGLLR